MNQLDTIKHAKGYLEQLCQGIDPISGQQVPPDSLVLQPAIHQHFQHIIDNLNLILQGDGGENRQLFSITEEQRKKLFPLPYPIKMSKFVELVNEQVDKNAVVSLSSVIAFNWLEEQGYIQTTGETKKVRTPTAQGQTVGIHLKNGTGPKGPYQALQFSPQAQQFLIDHLDDISAFRRKTAPSHPKKIPIKHPKIMWVNQVWLQQLAQGVDPTTGTFIQEHDVLYRKRLQKCFGFVAQMLEQALKNECFSAKKPFSLPKEVWSQIQIPEDGMLASLVINLNALIEDPTAVHKLNLHQLTTWLLQQGMMFETLSEKGRQIRRFTPKGEEMGFYMGTETNENGQEVSRLCANEAAQRYLLDHLGEIIALGAKA